MDIGKILSKIGKPFATLDDKITQNIAEKATLATRAALAEAPLLDALLDGEPVEIHLSPITIQLKRPIPFK